MAKKLVKKKSVKKNVSKKKVVARKANKTSKPTLKNYKPVINQTKSKKATRELILFSVLSLISFLLYSVTSNEIYESLFWLLSVIFFFVAVAFLIIFLIFFFLKILNKN